MSSPSSHGSRSPSLPPGAPVRAGAATTPPAVAKAHLQYVGFHSGSTHREYRLRVRDGDVAHEYTVLIRNAAFMEGRALLQDGPDICFLRMQRELLAAGFGGPSTLTISDQELGDYRVAHTPVARGRGRLLAPPTATPVRS